ncbi:MAG: hypothetical protein EBT59_14110 [Betaproteobacteria bacterium]|nr:hypothetical protein [Betaproteobacteria bacterium]NBU00210.1 hypothetical protein [Betaproteobacteria bacterium]
MWPARASPTPCLQASQTALVTQQQSAAVSFSKSKWQASSCLRRTETLGELITIAAMRDQTAIALPLRLKPEASVEREPFSAVMHLSQRLLLPS